MTMRRQALRSCAPLATSFFLSLILVLLFTLPSLLAQAEPAASGASAAATQAQPVHPGDMNTGALLLQSGEDGAFVEAPRLNTDVVMTVNGTIARVAVTQRFENPSDRWLEGVYVFPLPEQSAVDALHMEIGSRVIEGEIKGRDEAKQAYEAAKDAGQKASLVEQERPNIFTNSVANIGPHESNVIPTRSPAATFVTESPTASTTPAPSCPSTAGSGTGYHWSRQIRSVWQIPAAATRTSTSSSRNAPSSSSCNANGAPLLSTTAAVIFTGAPRAAGSRREATAG